MEVGMAATHARKTLTKAAKMKEIAARDRALTLLEPLVSSGLSARRTRMIAPLLPVDVDSREDFAAWQKIQVQRALLGVERWSPPSLLPIFDELGLPWGSPKTARFSVCDGCTTVFHPSRKNTARYCELCRHGRKAPPLGAVQLPQKPGEKITVLKARISDPLEAAWGGTVRRIEAWQSTTVGRCGHCEELILGRADKMFCDGGCEQKHRRHASEP
jgi:hypothetical protein